MDFELIYDATDHYRKFSQSALFAIAFIIVILAPYTALKIKRSKGKMYEKVVLAGMTLMSLVAAITLFSYSIATIAEIGEAAGANKLQISEGKFKGVRYEDKSFLLVGDQRVFFVRDGIVSKSTFKMNCEYAECKLRKGDYIRVISFDERIVRVSKSMQP